MGNKRGQVGFEYIILMGFVTLVISGIFVIALFYSNSLDSQVNMAQVNNFAEKIVSTSESIFYAGEPSRTTIEAYLPERVTGIQISDNSLIISVDTPSGLNVLGFPSDVNISGTIVVSQGIKRIKITAHEDYVDIAQA